MAQETTLILFKPDCVTKRLCGAVLQRFEAAGTGDPSYASGSWWRMSYLSAVTVTTLGFGDITPVSETARILVGLEAILGVVMVGLFLNALAARTRLP